MKQVTFALNNPNAGTRLWIEKEWAEGEILYAELRFVSAVAITPKAFSVTFSIPSVDMHSVWSPQTDANGMRKLGPNWKKKVTNSRFAHGLPVHSVLSAAGKNRITIAVSDVKTPLSIGTGISEERAELDCKVVFFTQITAPLCEYSAVLRLDMRDIPFYESIPHTVTWWEEEYGLRPMPVPEAAREAVDSLWYSFHQALDTETILKECRLHKPYGVKTVILDDGWQTENNNRGYAYCGDWELATAKIPDMRKLADEIHKLEMKLMLWYSVPYMGIRAKKYTQFHGKYLYVDQHRGIAALDPRYACVRQYLVQQYETAVRNWDLDGLKLDFVNAFRLTEDTPVDDPEMDVVSLEEAIERLLQEVTTRLRQLKPELLIEFRQGYIGPAMRSYGNMLRAADCPNDALSNKTAVLDLRLTSGKTPVHSDMLMWHPDEPAEKAALQLASVLFAVPQISVRMEAISLEQKEMLSYYLNFWQKNRKLLLDGTLRLWDPQAFYSKASAQLEGESITVLYTDTVVQKETEKTTAVNCGPERKIYFDGFADAFYRIVDCRGREVARGVLQKLTALVVPCAGMVLIEP